jgi:hypothetical protein
MVSIPFTEASCPGVVYGVEPFPGYGDHPISMKCDNFNLYNLLTSPITNDKKIQA